MKSSSGVDDDADNVYIGRSEVAMWIRVVSSWICMLIYIWSLIAPVLLPDRYVSRNVEMTLEVAHAVLVCSFGDD